MSVNAQHLLEQLQREHPRSAPRLTTFPSGSFHIDLVLSGEAFVVEYVMGQGYGLSRRDTATFGWEGVEEAFENPDELLNRIRLLEGA